MFDDIHDVEELIIVAIGAGSMCWENVSDAGVFDSTRAAEIADAAKLRLQTILAGEFAVTPPDTTSFILPDDGTGFRGPRHPLDMD